MRAGVLAAAVFCLSVSLVVGAPSQAQTPPAQPLPGFMPPYEITRIVRAAGFDPLAPPRREGTTYVLHATHFRGILMRVVVDARSGAIRAVNRIVSGPAPYGQAGMSAPPYGVVPAYPPYGVPAAYPGYRVAPAYPSSDIAGGPEVMPDAETTAAPTPLVPAPLPTAVRTGAYPLATTPPLPRPRPAELASRKADDAKPDGKPDAKRDAKSEARVSVPRKLRKRRQHFVQVPWHWMEKLGGAAGRTFEVALHTVCRLTGSPGCP